MRVNLQHLKVLKHCSPLDKYSEAESINQGVHPPSAQISHLEFIPPYPILNSREYTPPFVLATFLYISDELQDATASPVQLTVLSKWELQTTSPKLHASFEFLSSSSKKINSSSAADLPVSLLAAILIASDL